MATVDEDEVQRFAAEVRQHILRTADLEAHVVKTDPPCGAEVADAPHRARIERDAGVMRALESEENGAHALSCLQGAPTRPHPRLDDPQGGFRQRIRCGGTGAVDMEQWPGGQQLIEVHARPCIAGAILHVPPNRTVQA